MIALHWAQQLPLVIWMLSDVYWITQTLKLIYPIRCVLFFRSTSLGFLFCCESYYSPATVEWVIHTVLTQRGPVGLPTNQEKKSMSWKNKQNKIIVCKPRCNTGENLIISRRRWCAAHSAVKPGKPSYSSPEGTPRGATLRRWQWRMTTVSRNKCWKEVGRKNTTNRIKKIVSYKRNECFHTIAKDTNGLSGKKITQHILVVYLIY